MSAPLDTRPRPLIDAFRSVGSTVALLSSVATALVGWGVMSAAQGDASVALLGAVPGVVTLVGALLTAFGVISSAEGQVTPVSDPARAAFPGGPLVSLVPVED
jgi:hypothetical protein